MNGETQHGMQCAEFESLLAEAIDGALSEPAMQGFRAHAAACATCGPMFARAQEGLHWLKSLAEVEPPRNLVRNILIATSGAEAEAPAAVAPARPWRQRMPEWLRPVLAPVYATVRQPRFALTFGMAFFSITVMLNAAGLKVSDLRHLDLRPSALQSGAARSYYETSARVVKYYENIRFVYEIESRVRDLRNAARPEQPSQTPRRRDEQKDKNDNTSGQPDPSQENYSREEPQRYLAMGQGSDRIHFARRVA